MSVISVQNLCKQYRARKRNGLVRGILRPEFRAIDAVKDISFTVDKGESVAFLGPNGAGKTTTTKMMTGLMYPTAGEVAVLGFQPFERKPEFLRRIGLVMGNKAGLNWDLQPIQSFEFLREVYDIPESAFRHRLEELTSLLDVAGHLETQLRRLSLGERMKMELIGAIIHRPEVLFLDEPTIGLDIISKKNIRKFLREIHRTEGTTLILTSHDMDDIEQVCDRAIIINKGALVYGGALDDLTSYYRQERYIRLVFSGAVPSGELKEWGEVTEENEGSVLLKVAADRLVASVAELVSRFQLLDIHIESIPLEEVIGEIFKQK